jgi:C4-dicarboxylate-specific signal transduction histidine kinase
MSQTIDDFRYFFQPNKRATQFYLTDAFNHALSMLKQNLIDKNIDIRLNLGNYKPIYSYENEVIQVLINLLKNAQDALIEKKTPNPTIKIIIDRQNNMQSIKIIDNAGGIKNDILENIFDPYFSTKSKNGTGLGLYMSKMIIEEHMSGKLEVYNSDKGAIFKTTLPILINS